MRFRFGSIAILSLTLAILLRALVPLGWMLGAGAAGAVSLVPCPAAAPVAQHASHHGDRDHDDRAESACPYAVLLAPPLPAEAPPLPQRLSVKAEPQPRLLPPKATPPPPASPPPPARGPPAA